MKNEKGYKAAVNEGIIPKKQGKSLELALASARKAAAAAGVAEADAPLQSAAAATQERIRAIRATIDSRMVSHVNVARPAVSMPSQPWVSSSSYFILVALLSRLPSFTDSHGRGR